MAVLIAIPAARITGLALGAVICVAAVATVLRCKDYGHLAPGAALTVLSALNLALLVGLITIAIRRPAASAMAITITESVYSASGQSQLFTCIALTPEKVYSPGSLTPLHLFEDFHRPQPRRVSS